MSFKINYKGASDTLRMYEYKCKSCGEVFSVEVPAKDMQSKVDCECGAKAHRHVTNLNFSLDPICGDFVGATDKWVKHRENQIAKEKRIAKEHGESGLKPL